MSYIFITEDGVPVSDGKGGLLIYQHIYAAEKLKAELERRMKSKIEIRKHQPHYGQMRYGQGTDPGTKR